jgi:hypothetical protein
MIIRILAARAYVVILNGLYLADRRIRPGTVRVTFLIAESSGFPLAVLGSWRVLPAFGGSFQARALYHVEARPCASHCVIGVSGGRGGGEVVADGLGHRVVHAEIALAVGQRAP